MEGRFSTGQDRPTNTPPPPPSPRTSDRRLTVGCLSSQPGRSPQNGPVSADAESAVYVLAGQVDLIIDGLARRLARGQWAHVPAGRHVALSPVGPEPAKFFTVSLGGKRAA